MNNLKLFQQEHSVRANTTFLSQENPIILEKLYAKNHFLFHAY